MYNNIITWIWSWIRIKYTVASLLAIRRRIGRVGNFIGCGNRWIEIERHASSNGGIFMGVVVGGRWKAGGGYLLLQIKLNDQPRTRRYNFKCLPRWWRRTEQGIFTPSSGNEKWDPVKWHGSAECRNKSSAIERSWVPKERTGWDVLATWQIKLNISKSATWIYEWHDSIIRHPLLWLLYFWIERGCLYYWVKSCLSCLGRVHRVRWGRWITDDSL